MNFGNVCTGNSRTGTTTARKAFVEAKDDPEFQREFQDLLKNYAGRPTALTLCRNLTKGTKAKFI